MAIRKLLPKDYQVQLAKRMVVKFSALLAILILLLPTLGVAQVRVRKNVKALTAVERDKFINAVKVIKRYVFPQIPSAYDQLVKIAIDQQTKIYRNPMYLPFHRKYLLEFEKTLQIVDPSIMLPYWDWAPDSQTPERSIIFTNVWMGGNGDPNNDYIVKTGSFANLSVLFPFEHKLTRRFDAGNRLNPWPSVETMTATLSRSKDYATFNNAIESRAATAHNGIGGDMITAASPNDPIYWVYMASIDKYWDDWQKLDQKNITDFAGTLSDGTKATLDSLIPYYRVKVRSIMRTTDLGYKYEPIVVPSPPPPTSGGGGDPFPTAIPPQG